MAFAFVVIEFFAIALSTLYDSTDVASTMAFAFQWIYSKLFSNEQIHFFHFINLPMQYFPFAMLLFRYYYNDQSLRSAVVGLMVGHIVFYILFVLPVIINRPILKTPRILKRIFREMPTA
jgi:hypothetical protein